MPSLFKLLFAFFCFSGIAYEIYAIYFAQKSKQWPTTTATILNAQVNTTEDMDGFDTHSPEVHYAYRVDGVLYESKRLFFGSQMTSNYFDASNSLFGIAKNKRVTVYYDPKKPKRSVLHPGAGHVKPFIIVVYIVLYSASLYLSKSWIPI